MPPQKLTDDEMDRKAALVDTTEQVRDELADLGVGDVIHQCRRVTDLLVQLTGEVGQFSRQWRERVAEDSDDPLG